MLAVAIHNREVSQSARADGTGHGGEIDEGDNGDGHTPGDAGDRLSQVDPADDLPSLALGVPFGVLLFTTREGGILQNRPVNFILGRICDFFRSIPFILLAMVLLGLSRLLVGTAIGVRGAIIPLVFGTIPFLGRQVESALAEVPAGLIEAAQSNGKSPPPVHFVRISSPPQRLFYHVRPRR